MELLNNYAERLKHLPFDLRAEVMLADMLDDGISFDELILNPIGPHKRAFGRDIDSTEWIESQRKAQRWLQINLNRSGLYDLLPEGVFHQPTTGKTLTDKEEVLREMDIQRQREEASRRFFLPIEQEFLRQRVRIEQEERQFLNTADNIPDELMERFWTLPSFLTPIQKKRLLLLIPLMHQLAGDLNAMTACFEELIEERVSLAFDVAGGTLIQADVAPLGQWELGETSLFDGWLPNDEPTLCLTIRIDQNERIANYLPGQPGRQFIEWLSGYLVPLDVNFRLELDTSAIEDAFLLEDNDQFGRLDFNTYV
ncbi:hypothetical protein IC229_10460 [Spirosoma sp. BT702]|uniref:Uncharacterized protein n=1 Tax=Spirosoma profusum TaxID=2771354 RepID=A0A926XZF7_9BACT|nr:hypothetical protein [Spirosoma profusum]MBD2701057.1 hypothetical protein [Spirosoma profusum]